MPATPAITPILGLPRLAADDHTRLWEHHNALVDGLDGLFSAWREYRPVWSQSSGAVLSVGSGTLDGSYLRLGQLVVGTVRLITAADTNKGSGPWIFSLPPVTPKSWSLVQGSFACVRNNTHYAGSTFPVSSTSIGCIVGDLGRVSNTIPTATHQAGDWYTAQFIYEPA